MGLLPFTKQFIACGCIGFIVCGLGGLVAYFADWRLF